MSVESGQTVAVVGKNGSGKSKFLSFIATESKPPQGKVEVHGDIYLAAPDQLSSRQKLNTIARPSGVSATAASESLLASGLWDSRQLTTNQLSPGHHAAAELLPILSGCAAIGLVNRQIDQLDPITQNHVWDRITTLKNQGMILVVATHNLSIIEKCDAVVVLSNENFRFAGSIAQLRQYVGPTEFIVTTAKQQSVRALVEPFAVKIEETPGGMTFQAYEGQDRAVKLLLEGYGDVRYVITKQGTISDALGRLL